MTRGLTGWRMFAGFNGCVAVAMGAAGAHIAADVQAGALIERAAHYALIHSLVLLYLSGLTGAFARAARWLILAGIILFCGSLYLKGLTGWQYATRPAPFGGTSLMLGWLMLAFSGLRRR